MHRFGYLSRPELADDGVVPDGDQNCGEDTEDDQRYTEVNCSLMMADVLGSGGLAAQRPEETDDA